MNNDVDDVRTIKVLMVDDHPVVSMAVSNLLVRDREFEVRTAASGAEALALCNASSPDVILADLSLDAVMSGLEMIAALSLAVPRAKIVVFTSFTNPENITAALDAGAIGYISKSTDPLQLPKMLKDAHKGDPVYDPATQRTVLNMIRNRNVAPPPTTLTLRELEVLTCLCHGGGSTQEIADQLYLSPATVNTHLRNVFTKLGVSSRAKAINEAYRQRLVPPPNT